MFWGENNHTPEESNALWTPTESKAFCNLYFHTVQGVRSPLEQNLGHGVSCVYLGEIRTEKLHPERGCWEGLRERLSERQVPCRRFGRGVCVSLRCPLLCASSVFLGRQGHGGHGAHPAAVFSHPSRQKRDIWAATLQPWATISSPWSPFLPLAFTCCINRRIHFTTATNWFTK